MTQFKFKVAKVKQVGDRLVYPYEVMLSAYPYSPVGGLLFIQPQKRETGITAIFDVTRFDSHITFRLNQRHLSSAGIIIDDKALAVLRETKFYGKWSYSAVSTDAERKAFMDALYEMGLVEFDFNADAYLTTTAGDYLLEQAQHIQLDDEKEDQDAD